MTDPADTNAHVPLSSLPPEAKAERANSFGGVATRYERYRPGPPAEAVEWILPRPVGTVVDLGAGTGALTRLLVGRCKEVVAVEPDDRMRAVLEAAVPGARAVVGRGEAMPLPDASVDAVLASSSWHWMDPEPALAEMARILVPGGTLGALWTGPDPEGPFFAQARTMLADLQTPDHEARAFLAREGRRPPSTLEIPEGMPFAPPAHTTFRFDIALNADELVGLLGTFSSFILLPQETRARIDANARRLLSEVLGVRDAVTVDVGFRCEAWRTTRH